MGFFFIYTNLKRILMPRFPLPVAGVFFLGVFIWHSIFEFTFFAVFLVKLFALEEKKFMISISETLFDENRQMEAILIMQIKCQNSLFYFSWSHFSALRRVSVCEKFSPKTHVKFFHTKIDVENQSINLSIAGELMYTNTDEICLIKGHFERFLLFWRIEISVNKIDTYLRQEHPFSAIRMSSIKFAFPEEKRQKKEWKLNQMSVEKRR